MALQTILKKTYLETVFEEVEQGIGLDRFKEDTFPYDESYLLVTPQVKHPENLLEQLKATTDGDFQSAIAIYNAYPTLTPLQAINVQFWESLCLTDAFPYMRDRWHLREAKDEEELKRGIINHFTMENGLMRHGLGGLWWLVHLTVDEDRDQRFELTEMLFKNYTLRFIRLGVGKVIQHKEAAIGILQFIKDNERYITSMENVANNLTSYFNKLGAVKQLTFLDRHFFYHEMEEHIDEFMNTSNRDAQNSEDANP